MNKYNNIKTVVDGIKFDSKREAYYYLYYKRLQETKIISNLSVSPDDWTSKPEIPRLTIQAP